ncbi:hypothetical protein D0X99_12380 [Algoriphagus lacus]|uniref:Transposase n=1 Tax=Algoriphagus lacus TaxID=2056311 RepID=A0A418PRL7_9BACT|nr:hypothetical protein D0X99_12380 [Algoriphagus lacus]
MAGLNLISVIIKISNDEFFNQKVNYIHLNPVKANFGEKKVEYLFSSAADFFGIRKGKLIQHQFG